MPAKVAPSLRAGRIPVDQIPVVDFTPFRFPPTTSLAHLQQRFGATLPYLDGSLTETRT